MYCIAFAALPNAVSVAIIQEEEEAEEEKEKEEDEEKEHSIKEISREHLFTCSSEDTKRHSC